MKNNYIMVYQLPTI